METKEIVKIIEMGLLCADGPCPENKLQGLFNASDKVTAKLIKEALAQLKEKWQDQALELHKSASGWQFRSYPKYSERLKTFLEATPPRLSRPLTEVLAIVAYNQPVTRGDIEEIRGVSTSANQLATLEELGWVQVIGKRETPGRPFEYGTTDKLLDDLGLESINDLPELDTFFEAVESEEQIIEPKQDEQVADKDKANGD